MMPIARELFIHIGVWVVAVGVRCAFGRGLTVVSTTVVALVAETLPGVWAPVGAVLPSLAYGGGLMLALLSARSKSANPSFPGP